MKRVVEMHDGTQASISEPVNIGEESAPKVYISLYGTRHEWNEKAP